MSNIVMHPSTITGVMSDTYISCTKRMAGGLSNIYFIFRITFDNLFSSDSKAHEFPLLFYVHCTDIIVLIYLVKSQDFIVNLALSFLENKNTMPHLGLVTKGF
ncbi:hypothetical protein PHYBLDRAFT_58226 [Phycomyces blakesleeanus NRRL 1555(-)]|uniref:Uncharacterized protein n=1 Tax=Phycomyces blakesleeanus (strain ATCC 8743b / DSM 1359 / FGSC 10004 / NBRC 33097 / NRRL 1555) TaxID=763407 RepID=A0A163BA83_PHYB8|nr:hypothetical protein PHYBLDRAFT_58226 [Phycomyces blakesleeanus NRRL 1555(-)]OAD79181.1 hypothetical protein PHYBLDRAFT_58226 [Phycomyces blakesleeanus NRRL 1555(-)]|eukprot:XP_018297221.1 hypothetical protein PHYBLDRAFT_58226 [Phycomyces blakesleeanus NRRL 1555(-)]